MFEMAGGVSIVRSIMPCGLNEESSKHNITLDDYRAVVLRPAVRIKLLSVAFLMQECNAPVLT